MPDGRTDQALRPRRLLRAALGVVALVALSGCGSPAPDPGAQRSDSKSGDPARFPEGRGPQGDVIRIYNLVRCVRGGVAVAQSSGPDLETEKFRSISSPVTTGGGPPDSIQALCGSGVPPRSKGAAMRRHNPDLKPVKTQTPFACGRHVAAYRATDGRTTLPADREDGVPIASTLDRLSKYPIGM